MHYFYQVKERPDIGVYVKDLSAYVMNNADDMDRTMTLGNKNRKYHLTLFKTELPQSSSKKCENLV